MWLGVIEARSNADDVGRWLRTIRKQIPFASSLALNATAYDIKEAEEKEVDRAFDRPTPFTRRGIGVAKSSKRKLVSVVFVRPKQAAYLRYQIEGGIRQRPGDGFAVPLRRRPNLRLNQYGNLARGAVSRLAGRNNTFVGTVNGVLGLYRRVRRTRRNPSGGVVLLVAFETQTAYQPRLRYYQVAASTFHSRWGRNMDAAMTRALRTARP